MRSRVARECLKPFKYLKLRLSLIRFNFKLTAPELPEVEDLILDLKSHFQDYLVQPCFGQT